MGSETANITDELEPQLPTAVIFGAMTEGDIPTVREIRPPERHLGGIAINRQTAAVREIQTDTNEYVLPPSPTEGMLQRVRIEMRRRRVGRSAFARDVQNPSP